MNFATAKSPVQFKNILYATDLSPAAAYAIPFVRRIAAHYEAHIFAFHVRPPVNPMTPPAVWPSEEAIRVENLALGVELCNAFPALPVTPIVEEGDVLACLERTIEENNVDLVVLGTHGRTGIGKLLLGSVAEEIFRNVRCPVLTVGPHAYGSHAAGSQMREIIFATDLTPKSEAAAAYAVSLAEEFRARLILIHVARESETDDLVSWYQFQASAEALLRKLVPEEAVAVCNPEFFVERGIPADRVVELAHFRESNLIVLAVKGDDGLHGAATHLPFAIAHKIVSTAECPVLTIRH